MQDADDLANGVEEVKYFVFVNCSDNSCCEFSAFPTYKEAIETAFEFAELGGYRVRIVTGYEMLSWGSGKAFMREPK